MAAIRGTPNEDSDVNLMAILPGTTRHSLPCRDLQGLKPPKPKK